MVWRMEFPQDIAREVRSQTNLTGSLTNSDLELAAEVFAVGIIVETAPTIKHECDNSPTVSWIKRMASKYIFPTAGRLLRGLAYMLNSCQAGEVITFHVKGVDNVMADLASQPSKAMAKFAPTNTHLSDVDFLSSFNTEFPLPNNQEWKLATVPEWLKFNVFKTLGRKRLDLQQWASQAEQVLESVDAALSTLQHEQQWKTSTRRSQHAPHLCCCRAGRSVRSWTSSPSSVSVKSSPSRRPKVHSGRIPRSKKILSSPAQP